MVAKERAPLRHQATFSDKLPLGPQLLVNSNLLVVEEREPRSAPALHQQIGIYQVVDRKVEAESEAASRRFARLHLPSYYLINYIG